MQVGPYEILEEVARGGIGVLYKARDPDGRVVALKVLQVEGEATKRRFAREMRSMAQLEHANVARYYGAGVERGHPYLAMEFVEGRSLEERLRREGPLPLEEVTRIGVALCDALQTVHDQGLLHRDLKPDNVLENVAGRIVLTDFGLVKQDDSGKSQTLSLTASGGFLGTPGYWPPEQARGDLHEVAPHSDVYGLAATLYALLSGEPPRGGLTLLEVLQNVEAPVASLRSTRAEVPAALDKVLLRCLAAEPNRRPTLAKLSAAIASVSGDRAASGRSWALPAALGALGMALAVALGWGVAALDAAPRPTPEESVEAPPRPTFGVDAEVVLAAPGSHMGMVTELAVDATAGRIASGGLSGELRVWDARTGHELWGWWEPAWKYVEGVAFGPQGHVFAVAEAGTLLRVTPTGELSTRALGEGRPYDLDANARGELVTCGTLGVRLWSAVEALGEGPPPPRVASGGFRIARFHPQAGGLAVGGSGGWRWDAEGGGEPVSLHVEDEAFVDLAFSPDGERVATLASNRVVLYSWPDLTQLAERTVYIAPPGAPSTSYARSLCFSADGAQLYTVGAEARVSVWAVPELQRIPAGVRLGWRPWTERVRRGVAGTLVAGGNAGRLMAYSLESEAPLWDRAIKPAFQSQWIPDERGLSWLDSEGHELLLNTLEGVQALDLQTGASVSGPARGLWELLPVVASETQIFGVREGKLLIAKVKREGGKLSLGPPTNTNLQPDDVISDLAFCDGVLYAAGSPATHPKQATLWAIPVNDFTQGRRLDPTDLGGGRPRLSDTLPGASHVWLIGKTKVLRADLDLGSGEPSRLAARPRYMAQYATGHTLFVEPKTGAWRYETPDGKERLSGSFGRLNTVRAFGDGKVAVNTGKRIEVVDLRTEASSTFELPSGEFATILLPSPSLDALYVWTYRGLLLRYPLTR